MASIRFSLWCHSQLCTQERLRRDEGGDGIWKSLSDRPECFSEYHLHKRIKHPGEETVLLRKQ